MECDSWKHIILYYEIVIIVCCLVVANDKITASSWKEKFFGFFCLIDCTGIFTITKSSVLIKDS